MDNIFIAIVTNDKEYGRSLSLSMLSVCRSLIIRIFNAEEFLSEERDYDIILWDGEEVREAYGGRIVYLAKKPSDVVKNTAAKRFCIYKYSTAASTVASVFEIYEVLTGRRAVNLKRQDVRLFAFSSYSGGAGCTMLAMAAAQEFCRFRGMRVLYLSFEELESAGEFMGFDSGIKGAAVYLYELFNNIYTGTCKDAGEQWRRPFLEGKIVKDDFGVETFAPAKGRNPLRDLNPDELQRFMASLIDSGRFDVIIMDLGQWLSNTAMKCLEMAEKICFITPASKTSPREKQYMNQIISCCGESMFNKIINISNNPNGTEDHPEDHFVISRCTSFEINGDHRKIFLEGEFGNNISALAEELSEPV